MTPATIRKEIQISAPIEHVWQFIGSEEGLRQWWGADITLEARQGGRCVERGICGGAPYQLAGVVSVYDPPHRLVLVMGEEPRLAALPVLMHIAITLSEMGKSTLVQIVHQFYSAQQVEAHGPQRELPVSPLSTPPAILNQLTGGRQPGIVSPTGATTPAATRPFVSDSGHPWMSQQEARWRAGLANLMHAVQQRKESES